MLNLSGFISNAHAHCVQICIHTCTAGLYIDMPRPYHSPTLSKLIGTKCVRGGGLNLETGLSCPWDNFSGIVTLQ